MSKVLKKLVEMSKSKISETMGVEDYLELCKKDLMAYATAAERLLQAIGEPVLIDTNKDHRLSQIFFNKVIKVYPAFKDFYGIETTIEKIVNFIKHSAQNLEESKQILFLMGPPGSAKSSIVEKLKELMCVNPIYVLADKDGKLSPVFESPLGIFGNSREDKELVSEYNIPIRYIPDRVSGWAVKRLKEYGGDVTKFKVVKIYPSIAEQIAIMKVEPSDENNQDTSTLVGKTNIRMLEYFDQNDTDGYSYSGALNRANQGICEMVEIFKSPIKSLYPLLEATQSHSYKGTENISSMPWYGMVLAHCNMNEWGLFSSDKKNEAVIDRLYKIDVPYCLRYSEEQEIYNKMLTSSDLGKHPCVPETLSMLAKFCVLTRLKEKENSTLYSKLQVYNGIDVRETEPNVKTLSEYHNSAGVDEGMQGISTRFAFKVLSRTFNYDPVEIAADPVHLGVVLKEDIKREQFSPEVEKKYLGLIDDLKSKYVKVIGNQIQQAYLENYQEFGQNLFERYITYADHWTRDSQYSDPDTGSLFDKTILNAELEKIEKAGGITNNPKDFRNEVVNFVIRQEKNNKVVEWTSYEKMRVVIEKRIFSNVEELLPIISFTKKSNKEQQREHDRFIKRMSELGYTPTQTKRLVEFYLQEIKSS